MPPATEQYGGDWDGSNVHEDHVEFLRKTRRLPSADKVEVRLAPAKDITPELEEGVYPEGAYLVGLDVPAGDYTVAPVDKAPLSSYSVYSGILGTDARTLKFEVLRTEAACALHDGEYIELSGCTLRPAD